MKNHQKYVAPIVLSQLIVRRFCSLRGWVQRAVNWLVGGLIRQAAACLAACSLLVELYQLHVLDFS